jgi:hypothetical protein
MTRFYASWLAGIFLLMTGGCRTLPPAPALSEDKVAALPRQVELFEVPFFPQEEFQCGPAALAMVMKHAGVSTDPDGLKPEVYLPGREGTLQIEMFGAVRRHGLVAYQMSPVLGEVLEEVARGTPVVVLQNLALDWYPVWHYAVVIGYDLDNKEVILRSGRVSHQRMSLITFENTWARSAHWAMVAVPPEKIPYTAQETRYVAAVNAFGKVGQLPASRTAYLAAKERWPASLGVHIALGNVAYMMKHMDEAEAEFRAAVTLYPDSVAALNNLAQTLSDMGRDEEALEYVKRAAKFEGPLKDIVLSTQASIERKLKH